mmetsp:Transcript_16679/g.55540  ORF Transcript_16679/g.55540 Transcript_16679/m.55540 type:complete len:677 (-) Transcript_16679:706-2736(-)
MVAIAAAATAVHAAHAEIEVKEVSISDKLLLPDESLWIKEGLLEKKRVGATVSWNPRRAVLTKDALFFAKPNTTIIIDEIPLEDIVNILEEFNEEDSKDIIREIIVETSPTGINAGRAYTYKADSHEHKDWLAAVKNAKTEKLEAMEYDQLLQKGKIRQIRAHVKAIYESNLMQIAVAGLIFISFITDLAQAEVLPEEGSEAQAKFFKMDIFFTVMFTLELFVNLFAKSHNAFAEFLSDGWNLLDVVIVIASLLTVLASDIPSVKVFRLIRVFRVARIFRRLKSLNRIISALACAVLPVANSFLILALVTCIWAALGTQFFRFRHEPMFGSFSKSLFTMFQVVTGDGWASSVTRVLFDDETLRNGTDFGIALFFVSYVLIAGVVLINVVIAVLLDEFISSIQREKQEIERQEKIEEEKRKALTRSNGILDPLSSHLSHFVTDRDLARKIADAYERLDNDGSGGLNYEEFQFGLKRLPTSSPIHLQDDDFDLLTEGGKLCNSQGEFSSEQFQEMMREEIRRYAQRQVANAMQESTSKDMRALLLMIKLMDQRIDTISKIVHSWGYSNKGMARIIEVYYQHDKDDSGQLSKQEATDALKQLSIPVSKHDEVLQRLDSDGDGTITKEEFYSILEIIEELSDERLRNIEKMVASLQRTTLPQTVRADASSHYYSNPCKQK